MIPALYIFIAMVVIGVILFIHDRMSNRSGERREERGESGEECESQDECSDECCGTHEVCPSELMLRHMNDPVVYYEDEELDTFKGRAATEYSDEELEQWRDVLYTLKSDELMGWERSIKKRGIIMPEIIREEFVSMHNS